MSEDRFTGIQLLFFMCIAIVVTLAFTLVVDASIPDKKEIDLIGQNFTKIIVKTNLNQEQTYLVLLTDKEDIRHDVLNGHRIIFTNYELLTNSEGRSVYTKKNRVFIPFDKIDYIIFEKE